MPLTAPDDAALAAAAEWAEREAWRDLIAAGARRPEVDAQVSATPFGGDGLLLRVPALPLMLFNRVFGWPLGAAAPDLSLLDELPARYAGHAPGRWGLQPPPGPHEATLAEALAARGWQPRSLGMAKMARPLDPLRDHPPEPPAGLQWVQVLPGEEGAFAEPVAAGLGLPAWCIGWLKTLPTRPRWQGHVLHDRGRPVAAGALFLDGDIAWLGLGTTLTAWRGRGAHRLLMQARLAAAAQAGARWAFAETAEPADGHRSPSHDNLLACGFRRVATRLNWVR